MKTFILTLCVVIGLSSAEARPNKEPTVFFKPGETLYVQVIDHVNFHSVGRSDRFRNIKQTLEEVFEEVDLPLNYKIVRFGANRTPADQPQMHLTMMQWGTDGLSQIEARIGASLRRDYDRDNLGVFHERGGGVFFASDATRNYNEVLRKALIEMVAELNDHIVSETGVEETDEEGESLEVSTPEGE